MLLYDLAALILTGIIHILLYVFLIGYRQLSSTLIVMISLVFTILLGIVVTVTGYPEFNMIMLLLFLLSLGIMKKNLSFKSNLYFCLLSIVVITVTKLILLELGFQLILITPISLYTWTISVIHLIITIFMLVLVLISRNKIEKFANYIVTSQLYLLSYLLLIIGIVVLLIINSPSLHVLAVINEKYAQVSYIALLILFFIILLLLIIGSHLGKEKLKEEQQLLLMKERLDYVEKLEFTHAELASFRHDYVNILLALDEGVRTKNLAQIEQVYYNVIAPTSELINNHELDLAKLSAVMIPELKSVLSVKIITAQQQEVKVMIDIPHKIERVLIPIIDYIRIISIILDNAIEEAKNSKEKTLQIAMFEQDGQQYFIVRNSCNRNLLNLQQLYEQQYSHKKGDRGYGLFSLKRLIDKTKFVTLETSFLPPYFTQTITFKNIIETTVNDDEADYE